MPLDQKLLGEKLQRYRQHFSRTLSEVSEATGIGVQELEAYEAGASAPSGDEILIFADYYKCDYKFFISNEKLAPFEETETMFRRYGDEFSKEDRWAVQEFLFLSECESFIQEALEKRPRNKFILRADLVFTLKSSAIVQLRNFENFSSTPQQGSPWTFIRICVP
jgi:transcriptional regulator with XRE-family HTH domain